MKLGREDRKERENFSSYFPSNYNQKLCQLTPRQDNHRARWRESMKAKKKSIFLLMTHMRES